MEDKLKLIIKNAGFSFGGQVGGTITRTFYHLLIANLLGAASYGLYALGISIMNILSMLSLFGLNMTVVKYISQYQEKNDIVGLRGTIRFSVILVAFFSVFWGGILFLFSKTLSLDFFKKSELTNVLKIFSLAIIFQSLLILLSFIFRGFKKLKYSALIRDLLQPAIALILFIILYSLGFGLFAAVFGFLISVLASSFLGFYLLSSKIKIRAFSEKARNEGLQLLKFSFPILLLYFTIKLLNRTDVIMIGYFMNSKAVGIYSFVYRISYLLFLFWFSFNAILGPILSSMFESAERDEINTVFKTVSRWIFTLTAPFALFFMVNSEIILGIFKKVYLEGKEVMIILAFMWLILSFSSSAGNVLIMAGKREKELYFSVPMVVLNIAMNFLLISKMGIKGAALATLISLVGFNFFKVWYINKKLGLFPLDKNYLKPFFSLIITTVIFLFLFKFVYVYLIMNRVLFLIFSFGFGLIVYFGFIILMGLPEEDKIIISEFRLKLRRVIK